jgi:hypothetical protein
MSFLSSRARAFVAANLALALAFANVPSALHAAEPTPADKATARDAYLAGTDLRAKGNHKGALEKFRAAYALLPTPITALEVGRSLVDTGQLIEGNEKLIEAATMPAKPNESADAKKARADAKKLADEVEARIPSIKVQISGAPDGGSIVVSIDGRDVPVDALATPRKVNPGKHTIVAKVEGGEPSETTVTVAEGESRTVKLAVKAPDTSERASGAARRHDGERTTPPPPHVEASSTSAWAYIGFTVAGVGLGVGAIQGLRAKKMDDDLANSCPKRVSCSPSDVSNLNTTRTTAYVSLGVGVVGLGVGVAALVWGGESKRTGAWVAPWVGVGSIGLKGAF